MHCSVHQRLFSARSIVLTVASQCFYETDSMITNSGLWLPLLLRGEGKKPESLDNQARGQRVPILINFLMYQALFSWRFEPKRNQKQKSSKRLKISVPHIVFRKRWMQLTLQMNVKYDQWQIYKGRIIWIFFTCLYIGNTWRRWAVVEAWKYPRFIRLSDEGACLLGSFCTLGVAPRV